MADKRDYYEVLGVDKGASDSEIKSAFRRKAKECHPDLHPDDKVAEAQFKELNEAYEVLSDSDKRAKYDQFGHAAFDPSMGGGNPFTGGGFSGFGDIIDQVFGGGFGGFGGYSSATRNGPVQGNDLRYSLTLTFEEAAFGVKKEILIPREESCPTCSGSGAKPGTTPTRCTTCGGTGQVRTQQQTMFGSFASTRPCSACKGTGKIITDPCSDCRGTGRIRKNTRIAVSVPAGIDNGQTISLAGEGEDGLRGGPSGDLYITVGVKPHNLFKREGYNLLLDFPISFTTAALGGDVQVPTLSGPIKYRIPEGTQPGTEFRIKGQGIQQLRGNGKGDLILRIKVEIPKRLNNKQKDLLREFDSTTSDREYDNRKNFLDRVKELFQ